MAVSEGNAHDNVMNVMIGQYFDCILDALNQDQCIHQNFHLICFQDHVHYNELIVLTVALSLIF